MKQSFLPRVSIELKIFKQRLNRLYRKYQEVQKNNDDIVYFVDEESGFPHRKVTLKRQRDVRAQYEMLDEIGRQDKLFNFK